MIPSVDDWVALSDRGVLESAQPGATLLHAGLFVMELALPLQSAMVLLNHQADDGWPRTFAVFHDLAAGLVILHRQGRAVVRHVLPGPLPQGRGTGRLSFRFDAPARSWSMTFELLGCDPPAHVTARGTNPLPLPMADVQTLCTASRRDGPVLWFGLTRGAAPPSAAAWIGLRTPVETTLGPVAAGNLLPGTVIMTADHGPLPLQHLRRFDLPSRGSFAPVLLRSPFFGQAADLLVSADQLITVAGAEAEYLFGEDSVLMQAQDLVDGRTALSDQRRAVTSSVALDLGRPALIVADGCLLACGFEAALPHEGPRKLHSYEVLTLMALLGRSARRSA
jgi:Hint domain